MARYKVSPIGPFEHPWVNRPDTAFGDTDGTFKVDLVLNGEPAQAFKKEIDISVEAAFAEKTDKMTPGEKKKWDKAFPYEIVEDDEGNETGEIKFKFRQNAKVKVRKTGETKDIKIELRDSKDQVVDAQVWSGSEGRIMFSPRAIEIASTKKIGVRLDFSKVQITKLQKGSGGGFGAVDGGFVAEEGSSEEFGAAPEDNGGDY